MSLKKLFALFFIISLCLSCQNRKIIQDDGRVNVKSFGAKGNGTSDDTDAIQAAISYCKKNGIAELFIPKGTYIISRTKIKGKAFCLKTFSNFSIIGEDKENTILKLSKNNLPYTRLLYVEKVKNFKLSNLTIDGDCINQQTENEHMHGVWINESDNIAIDNCQFLNTCGDGITIRGSAKSSNNVLIEDSFFNNNFRNGITLGTGFKNITIRNNEFQTLIDDSPIDSEPQGGKDGCGNVLIENNKFLQEKFTLITLGGYRMVNKYTIKNNYTKNCGFFLIRCTDVDIHSNEINVVDGKKAAFTMHIMVDDVRIFDNKINATNTNVVHAFATKDGKSKNISFYDNEIEIRDSKIEPINIQGTENFSFRKNEVSYSNKNDKSLFKVHATDFLGDIEINDNKIETRQKLFHFRKLKRKALQSFDFSNNSLNKKKILKKDLALISIGTIQSLQN